MGVAFGDYDGDGRLDVMVTNDTMPNFLFHNQGDGTFREVGLTAGVAYNEDGNAVSAMGLDFRDYDNDGRDDAFITTLTNESFSLLRNIGGGQFANLSSPSRIASASMPWTGWGVGLYDFNNDGWKDAFVACGHVQDNAELTSSRQSRQPNILFLNAGNGAFSAGTLSAPAFHRGVAFGDFDRDGRMDAVPDQRAKHRHAGRGASAVGDPIAPDIALILAALGVIIAILRIYWSTIINPRSRDDDRIAFLL